MFVSRMFVKNFARVFPPVQQAVKQKLIVVVGRGGKERGDSLVRQGFSSVQFSPLTDWIIRWG